jgi:hypothetical protein
MSNKEELGTKISRLSPTWGVVQEKKYWKED